MKRPIGMRQIRETGSFYCDICYAKKTRKRPIFEITPYRVEEVRMWICHNCICKISANASVLLQMNTRKP